MASPLKKIKTDHPLEKFLTLASDQKPKVVLTVDLISMDDGLPQFWPFFNEEVPEHAIIFSLSSIDAVSNLLNFFKVDKELSDYDLISLVKNFAPDMEGQIFDLKFADARLFEHFKKRLFITKSEE